METQSSDPKNHGHSLNSPMEVFKTFSIEAARSLPNLPDDHPCTNIHGHSFKITITVSGNINETSGFVIDFGDVDTEFKPIFQMIYHSF